MDILSTPKKNIVLDATMLSTLMSCSRFYDIRFNHQLVSMKGKSNSLEIGGLIHKVLEVYYKNMIKGIPRKDSISKSLVAGKLFIEGCPSCKDVDSESTSCGHEPAEYPGLTNTPEDNSGWDIGWKFALDTCEQYYEMYKNDAFIPLAAESVKGEVIYEDDEIRILWKAKFDLIIDTNQIGIVSVDHKTFKQRRNKSSLSNQFMGHCVLLKSRNVIVNKIGLQTTLKIGERLTREVVSYSKDRLDEWQNETIPYEAYRLIQFMESGYWPPDYTHCDNMYGQCQYKNVCESDRGMRVEVLRAEFTKSPKWDPHNRDED